MRIAIKTAAVLLAVAALCGLGSLTSLAAADTPSASPSTAHSTVAAPQQVQDYSRGFHITNNTGSPITVKSITGSGNYDGRPDVGHVLQPGQYDDFEVTWEFLDTQRDDVMYSNGTSTITAHLRVDGMGEPSSDCQANAGPDVCTSDGGTNISITGP